MLVFWRDTLAQYEVYCGTVKFPYILLSGSWDYTIKVWDTRYYDIEHHDHLFIFVSCWYIVLYSSSLTFRHCFLSRTLSCLETVFNHGADVYGKKNMK